VSSSATDNRQGSTPTSEAGDLDLLIGAPYYDAALGNVCDDTQAFTDAGRVIQTSGRLPHESIAASRVGDAEGPTPLVAGVVWSGAQPGRLGSWVSATGDVTGDGLDDVGLGAPAADTTFGTEAGAVYVVAGAAAEELGETRCVGLVGQTISGTIFVGESNDEHAGMAVTPAGQFDGEGADDFAVGSPGYDAEKGTVHMVLEAAPDEPGQCPRRLPEPCIVADLDTGAQLIIPVPALGATTTEIFTVEGLVDATLRDSACGTKDHPDSSGYLLAGTAAFGPEAHPAFSEAVTIDIPIFAEIEEQLVDGEDLAMAWCEEFVGWNNAGNGEISLGVQANQYVSGRKAQRATLDSGSNRLVLWGVFVPDGDQDGARLDSDPSCDWDCDDTDATVWNEPGKVDDLSVARVIPAAQLSWSAPAEPGGDTAALVYDVVRVDSDDAAALQAAAFTDPGACCLLADSPTPQATETAIPAPGKAFFYTVTAQNACSSLPAHVPCKETDRPRDAIDCLTSDPACVP
jgi:hypothetical protein